MRMKIGENNSDDSMDTYSMSISFDEMVIISNCLNEVCHGLDKREMQTRTGYDFDEIKRLLREFLGAISEFDR